MAKKMAFLVLMVAIVFAVATYVSVPNARATVPTASLADRPVLQVGDTWVFRTADSKGVVGEETRTVTKIGLFQGMKAYFISSTNINGLLVVLDEDTNFVAYVDSESGAVVGERTGIRHWEWPLVVGNSWNFSVTWKMHGRTTLQSTYFVVEAYEEVVVPAGVFGAFRVVERSQVTTAEGRQFEYLTKRWWAPAIGNLAKYIGEAPTGFWVNRELLRYSPRGRM